MGHNCKSECKHKDVEYCKKCEKVFCKNCDREWNDNYYWNWRSEWSSCPQYVDYNSPYTITARDSHGNVVWTRTNVVSI